jgi:NADP-dependent 3-hydroxy acid dehydrogenase YdfG
MNALASCPKAQPGGSANPLTSLAALPLDLSVAGRADTTEDVGEVDILINNAGIALFGPTAEFDVSAFDKMFASNFGRRSSL